MIINLYQIPPPILFYIFLVFFRKNEKCLELPDSARKLIRKTFKKKENPEVVAFLFLNEKCLEFSDDITTITTTPTPMKLCVVVVQLVK